MLERSFARIQFRIIFDKLAESFSDLIRIIKMITFKLLCINDLQK